MNTTPLTLKALRAIMPAAGGRASIYLSPLITAVAEFEINTPARMAAFLAQIAWESGSLRYTEEIADGAAYDDREDLGNTRPEAIAVASARGTTPGRFWKGHGPIQITGFDNHLACGKALGLDLVNNPELICEVVNGCRAAAWFWKTHGCNELADRGQFKAITRRINGGYTALAQRTDIWKRAKVALGVS